MEDDGPRSSLLDVVLQDYQTGKDLRCSRAFVIGQLRHGVTTRQVEDFHRNFVQHHETDGQATITGLLLQLNQQVIVHVLEAPTRVLVALLKAINPESSQRQHAGEQKNTGTAQLDGSHLLRTAKVCSMTEEVVREYPAWVFRSATTPHEEEVVIKAYLPAVFDVYKQFLELGREAKAAGKERGKDLLKSTKQSVVGRFPSPDRIGTFCESVEVCGVSEYLEIFHQPIDLTLEEELVWPVEPFLEV